MGRGPAPDDLDGWVSRLARPSHRQQAKARLVASGPRALPALRRGLRHPKPSVRLTCVRLFDRLLDDGSLGELVAALDDEDGQVRAAALHALACDRCKEGGCRPAEDLWVPRALAFVVDGDADLRAAAIDALGRVAPRRPEAAAALRRRASSDPDRGLRGMARRRLAAP